MTGGPLTTPPPAAPAAPLWGRIAQALGPWWSVADPTTPARVYDYAILHGRGDEVLCISRVEGYGSVGDTFPARVRIRGTYERLTARGAIAAGDSYHVENPSITVATSKAPHVIAREIARRLLPGYRAALATALENAAQRQARATATAALYERLAAYQPGARHHAYSDDRARCLYPALPDRGHAKIELTEGEPPAVKVEVWTRDAALAERLMCALVGADGTSARRPA